LDIAREYQGRAGGPSRFPYRLQLSVEKRQNCGIGTQAMAIVFGNRVA
jgi:hypothetical protein